ncbi:MAG: hypothetical protein QXS18_06420 [Thermoplasmata archaeon]
MRSRKSQRRRAQQQRPLRQLSTGGINTPDLILLISSMTEMVI